MNETIVIEARPYSQVRSGEIEFSMFDVEDDNCNPHKLIVFSGQEYRLVSTNSNYMTATYRIVEE